MGRLSNVKSFIRTRMESLGYVEHEEGFEIGSIPETVLDKTYHVYFETSQGSPVNHTHLETENQVLVRIFIGSRRNINEAIDDSISAVDDILVDFLKIENRTETGAGVLNVVFDEAEFVPVDDTNGKAVLVNLRFNLTVLIGVEGS